MPPFAFCAATAPGHRLEGSRQWDRLKLEQLLFGEWQVPRLGGRLVFADVNTTVEDWPCLNDVLALAAERTTRPFLVLMAENALLSPAFLATMELMAGMETGPCLVIGRSWRVAAELWALSLGGDHPDQHPQPVDAALTLGAVLDPPEIWSWALLPRKCLFPVPARIAAAPEQAIPWLIEQARCLDWPVIEATAVAPMLRPIQRESPQGLPDSSSILSQVPGGSDGASPLTRVIRSLAPAAPRISFLVVGRGQKIDALRSALRSAPTLPWEVIDRQDPAVDSSDLISATWNDALATARGDLVWPLLEDAPPLALIPVVLRYLDGLVADMVQLAWRIGTQSIPASDPSRLIPGCLVMDRAWILRLGGFPEDRSANSCLRRLVAQGKTRGAVLKSLPLEACHR